MTWGDSDHYAEIVSPDECWALRRGCIHQINEFQPGIVCQHIKEMNQKQHSSLCIPLMAQNEIFGLLFIYRGTDVLPSEKLNTLISVVAETISLAIANIRLKELLHSQSIRDPLTGLLNRRFLDEYLIKQIGQAKRTQTSIAFIMLDVDNFKKVNDTFGHETGDYVLSLLGNLLGASGREGDVTCRYGGEEFLFVLPNCDLEHAKECAETIRNEVHNMPIRIKENVCSITISLGISIFPNSGSTSKELIDTADKALYEAKKRGKNRTFIFSDIDKQEK
ncbi:TPA: sensor domain-containing diguanylate cyclase [Legionella anisa]